MHTHCTISTVNLSQLFSCMMEPPTAAETVAKYFVIFTSSVDLMSKLTKNASMYAHVCTHTPTHVQHTHTHVQHTRVQHTQHTRTTHTHTHVQHTHTHTHTYNTHTHIQLGMGDIDILIYDYCKVKYHDYHDYCFNCKIPIKMSNYL